MMVRASIVAVLSFASTNAVAQPSEMPATRRITLSEAVGLALAHNHEVRLAKLSVTEKEHVKEIARSAYFPSVRNDTMVVQVTDTQLIQIPAGGLGVVGHDRIPPQPLTINQGGLRSVSNGTSVVQPLTQLFRVKAANDVARAEAEAMRGKALGVEDAVAVAVHQVYYRMLIADVRQRAALAKIQASEYLQRERIQQVQYGSALAADLIESRAHTLRARHELLTAELQRADLQLQLNDLVGLPLATPLLLDPHVATPTERCQRGDCVRTALEGHPQLAEARALVDKAAAAVRLTRYEIIPDVDVFARYTFHNHSAFFAPRFGTLGIRASIDLFDGGRKRAVVREREVQLAQARENLARITDDVELQVQTAYNKLERTRQMIAVATELLALRGESRRVATHLLANGGALGSQAKESAALELEATAALLQSQLDYVLAADELDVAIGRGPR